MQISEHRSHLQTHVEMTWKWVLYTSSQWGAHSCLPLGYFKTKFKFSALKFFHGFINISIEFLPPRLNCFSKQVHQSTKVNSKKLRLFVIKIILTIMLHLILRSFMNWFFTIFKAHFFLTYFMASHCRLTSYLVKVIKRKGCHIAVHFLCQSSILILIIFFLLPYLGFSLPFFFTIGNSNHRFYASLLF